MENLEDPKKAFHEYDLTQLLAFREGQCFDRKWKPQPKDIATDLVAFANSNDHGGLLLVGVGNEGQIKGLRQQYGENYQNEIRRCSEYLSHVTPDYRFLPVVNEQHDTDEVVLIYVPFSASQLATTSKGDVYVREGDRTRQVKSLEEIIELSQLRGSGIPFGNLRSDVLLAQADFHQGVLKDYLTRISAQAGREIELDRVLLSQKLALKDSQEAVWLTKSGLLLLTQDPRHEIPGAYVRVLKYEGREVLSGAKQNLVQDELFSGPVPVVAQRVRDYIRTQMRRFQYLGPNNRFISVSELPEPAWFEAILNALVHRSYNMVNDFILVRLFDDRLEVHSPGTYPPGVDPSKFPQGDVSRPRNHTIMEFMQKIQYVQMLHEGTRRMFAEMEEAGLPAPHFSPPGETHVIVTLYNDIDRRRDAQIDESAAAPLGNLFRLVFHRSMPLVPIPQPDEPPTAIELRRALEDAIAGQGWAVSSFTHDTAIDFRVAPLYDVQGVVSFHDAFRFQVNYYTEKPYLVLDYKVEVRNRATLSIIEKLAPSILYQHLRQGFAKLQGQWYPCLIRRIERDEREVLIELFTKETDQNGSQMMVGFEDILPNLNSTQLSELVRSSNIKVNVFEERRRLSHLEPANRLEKIRSICKRLQQRVFPVTIRGYQVILETNPTPLRPPDFYPGHPLREPAISFFGGKQSQDIIGGLTNFGAFEKPNTDLPLILIAAPDKMPSVERLVERIQKGSVRYQGFQHTFGARLRVLSKYAVHTDDYLSTCHEVASSLMEKPVPLVLIYMPDQPGVWGRSNYRSPYYQIKHYLLESGIPSQGVDQETLANPEWKDLNLALAIFAKAGYAPWVLDEGLPLADLFIGLSYSSIQADHSVERLMAYVCVFDSFGRWQYYKGNTQPIPFDRRDGELAKLIQNAIGEYSKAAHLQHIHIHHGYRMKYDTAKTIADMVFHSVPGADISFLYVNDDTPVRLFGGTPDSRYLVERGTFVKVANRRAFFLATTGKSDIQSNQKGTPRTVEAQLRYFGTSAPTDLTVYAQHVLSLTKLNWASTRPYAAEPITLLYASKIARYMNIFIRSHESFTLHPDLERTPWFL